MNYPNSLKHLIDCFNKLPGVGHKTAERMALAVLNFDDNFVNFFSNSLVEAKTNTKRCPICNSYTDLDVCSICSDDTRNSDILCIIDDAKNAFLFEKIGSYMGKYHVIDGLISPLDGIGPEDINLDLLEKRIENENIKELILAIKPSIEGETTCMYISRLFYDKNIKISKIAHGIPVGTDIDYLDTLTLELAIEGRKEIN